MTLFGMQVACACTDDRPAPMENLTSWDGNGDGDWVEGRRYVWECQICGHQVCVNIKEMDEDEQ